MNIILQTDAPFISPEDLIGMNLISEFLDTKDKAEVKNENPDETFEMEFLARDTKDTTYEELVNTINKNKEDGHELWTFSEVLDHKTKKEKIGFEIKWDTGEITWEAMSDIRKNDLVTTTKYAQEKGLCEEPCWKWTRKLTKNPKKS